ncbi:MAG: hypothetical protein IPO87_18040 [Flavobacteriales bacterium]|nr:hypothetical protein [Flavobacteriales bacterium]
MRYYKLKQFKGEQRAAVVETIERLRKQLDTTIPAKDSQENLLLATWNIRDFDKANRAGTKGHGGRLPETLFYLAEIISRFDMVAVQEVNGMDEWDELMFILGPEWTMWPPALPMPNWVAMGNG